LTIPLVSTLIIIGVLLLLSAFFSGAETALLALNRIRLRHMAEQKVRNAKTVTRLISNLEKLLASIIVGNNLVNVAISILGGVLFVEYFGQKFGILIGTFTLAFVILFFGEVIPKTFAAQRTLPVALFVAQPIRFVVWVLSPFSRILNALANFFIRIFFRQPLKRSPVVTEEEIRIMIEVGKEEGVVVDDVRKMLHRIFEFGDTKVSDVMTPKDQIASIDINTSQEDLLQMITEEGYSRLPVYEGSPTKVIGIIYARELLHLWNNKVLVIVKDLVRPVYYVNKEKKVLDLLREFQKLHLHMAVVVNEKNEAIGLVTVQDLIEEIVGEMEEDYSSKIT